jgi:hypothetical protein
VAGPFNACSLASHAIATTVRRLRQSCEDPACSGSLSDPPAEAAQLGHSCFVARATSSRCLRPLPGSLSGLW